MLELPLRIPGFKGSFSYGDISVEGEGNRGNLFSELFDSRLGVDFFFVGKITYNFDKWNIQTDVFGGQIRHAIEFKYNDIPIDVEIFTVMPRLFAEYKLYDTFIRNNKNLTLQFCLYGGIKYYHLNLNADFETDNLDFEVMKHWIDPIVGFTIPFTVSKWKFIFQNEYGGFGIGSELSWFLQLQARYDISKHLSINGGWIIQDIKYSQDKLQEKFIYDVQLSGPMAGIAIRF